MRAPRCVSVCVCVCVCLCKCKCVRVLRRANRVTRVQYVGSFDAPFPGSCTQERETDYCLTVTEREKTFFFGTRDRILKSSKALKRYSATKHKVSRGAGRLDAGKLPNSACER